MRMAVLERNGKSELLPKNKRGFASSDPAPSRMVFQVLELAEEV